MTALDTSFLIYSCDRADPIRQRRAIDLIESTEDGVMLWQVACEFIAASRKLQQQGFTLQDAWDRLTEFLDLFPLMLPDPGVLQMARDLNAGGRWSFWDSTIVAACMTGGVGVLYSEDLPGRQPPEGLRIVNPFSND